MNAQKRNHISFEATDGEKEIFKQDCQLQGKTTNRYPHADTAITRLKDDSIYGLQSWRCLPRLAIDINREAFKAFTKGSYSRSLLKTGSSY